MLFGDVCDELLSDSGIGKKSDGLIVHMELGRLGRKAKVKEAVLFDVLFESVVPR